MKRLITIRIAGALLAGALLTFGPLAAHAATTTAGTSISNTATVNYQVGGVAQTPGSATATFKVDDKVIITVTHSDASYSTTNTQPGSTKAVLTFKVENDGNANQDVYLSAVNMAAGTADPFGGTSDAAITTSAVYSDSGCTTPETKLTNLAPGSGSAATVYVCSTIPSSATDGEIAVVGLLTQVGAANGSTFYEQNGTSYSDDSATTWDGTQTQIIFAEPASAHAATGDAAAYDGYSSDLDAFKVQAAELTITKTAAVMTDPVNCATPGSSASCGAGKLHAIPGAVMQYTITIANASTASSNATGISVVDGLPANLTWLTGNLKVATPGVNSGGAFVCADSGTATTQTGTSPYTNVTCDYNVTSAGKVTVSGILLKPNDTATITFEATIN